MPWLGAVRLKPSDRMADGSCVGMRVNGLAIAGRMLGLPALMGGLAVVVCFLLGGSDGLLVVGFLGSLKGTAVVVLVTADRCELRETARTRWVVAGCLSVVATWCVLVAALV